jgi:hypothetical protein
MARHRDSDPTERRAAETARNVQLVNREEENVELAHDSKARGHFPETPEQPARRPTVELEGGNELPQAARRDPSAVERPHVPVLEPLEGASESVDTPFEEL